MTVQDLFQSLDINQFVRAYFLYDKCCYEAMYEADGPKLVCERLNNKIRDTFLRFRKADVKKSDEYVVFAIPFDSKCEQADTFMVKRSDLEGDKKVEKYAYDFEDPLDILGVEVSQTSIWRCGAMTLACAIFDELTFAGFDEDEHAELCETIKKDSNTVSFAHAMRDIAHAMGDIGIVDNRSDIEKQLALDIMRMEAESAHRIYQRTMRAERCLTEPSHITHPFIYTKRKETTDENC